MSTMESYLLNLNLLDHFILEPKRLYSKSYIYRFPKDQKEYTVLLGYLPIRSLLFPLRLLFLKPRELLNCLMNYRYLNEW